MNRILKIMSLFVSILIVSGCVNTDSEKQTGNVFESNVQNNLDRHGQFVEPMPADVLNQMADKDILRLYYYEYNTETPPQFIHLVIDQFPNDPSRDLRIEGYNNETRQRYVSNSISVREFEDLVNYIVSYPDVFFDYSEFEGAEPGSWDPPVELMDQYFSLSVPSATYDPALAKSGTWSIMKGNIQGEITPPEIQYVIDILHDWWVEIQLHPDD